MIEHWHWSYFWGIAAALNLYYHLFMNLFDGDELVSTGQRVTEWTAR